MKKRLAITAIVLSLAALLAVGASLAYLFVDTTPIVNTFVYGDINITLTESETNYDSTDYANANANTYKMIPGNTLPKDPKVTVVAESEACWLFVKIVESDNFDNFMTYAIKSGWKLYNTGVDGANIDTVANDSYVIYREVPATGEQDSEPFSILAGDSNNADGVVTVKGEVTKGALNALDANGAANYPKLTFTAYAVQKANLSLEQAYDVAFPKP